MNALPAKALTHSLVFMLSLETSLIPIVPPLLSNREEVLDCVVEEVT